jgi:chemotaxis regulatin CheY-phosphate phosphatase CheZ
MPVTNVVEMLFGLIPLLDKIKGSINESSGAIPRAAVQLSSVSKATEMATVEILNVLDRMTERIVAAELSLQTIKSGHRGGGEVDAAVASVEASLGETRQDSLNIAMTLQVQDITSQQIAGVTYLIESVRQQLVDALGCLDQKGAERIPRPGTAASVPTHFDTNAVFTKSTERQDTADAIIKHWNKADNE